MTNQLTQTVSMRLYVTLFAVCFLADVSTNSSFAQEIKYEDRIGSNKDFDMCEDFRFKRITKLVKDGKISQQQGYNIWKRIQSDKKAVKKIFGEAVAANELTQDQADRLPGTKATLTVEISCSFPTRSTDSTEPINQEHVSDTQLLVNVGSSTPFYVSAG